MTGLEAPERKAEATARQVRASDPSGAAWVSAHAGSGKTHVLVNRVIRLLLMGTDPARILCLTYTRAAAAEMKNRIFERLSRWIDKDDEALREAIGRQIGTDLRFPDETMEHVRRLFARALETPGGLKVQTIHAFCEKLLQAFPVEAGLAPGFEVLDEGMASELLARARAEVISRAGADGRMREALRILSAYAREETFDQLLNDLLAQRRILIRMWHDEELRKSWRTVLAERIGAEFGEDPETALAEWIHGLDLEFLRRMARLIERHGTNGEKKDKLPILLEVIANRDRPAKEIFELLKGLVLIKDGTLRKTLLRNGVTKADPVAARTYAELASEILRVDQALKASELLKANLALLEVGMAVMERYEALKRSGGFCDYDDLIARTLDLLSDDNISSAWVLYRLDGGIDHVLVDEAQDTSPEQWEIIRLLTEEFCAGEGTRDTPHPRTVFAVGDFKQSIYSFQGAEPAAFRIMRERFRSCYDEARIDFVQEEMNISFRTAPAILKAVDKVLERVDIGLDGKVEPHLAVWHGAPGRVEVWLPEVPAEDAEKRDIWRAPERIVSPDHPRTRLARRMARTIRELVAQHAPVRDPDAEGGFRPARYGDFLVLLRRRANLMDAIITALKQEGVPVAGADRLKVTDHLAVQDLMALGRFLLNREDDLSLACVLKSPLLLRDDGRPFDDDDLMTLCLSGDGRGSLWHRLRRAAETGTLPCAQAVKRLEDWWGQSGFLPPYEFYAHLLGRDGRRRAFLARMGAEAGEPLDEFLDMARNHEREHPASLTGFLDHLETAEPELKREMEAGADEVRVMTVHGAKGLEAPIVFLPDTCNAPGGRNAGGIIRMSVRPDDPEGPEMPLWTLRRKLRSGSAEERLEEWKRKQKREHYRLLYVAMTRARDRLYVGGFLGGGGKNKPPQPDPESWYAVIRDALFPGGENDPYALRDDTGALTGWRLDEGASVNIPSPEAQATELSRLPSWVRTAPPPEPGPAGWLAPSRITAGEEEVRARPWMPLPSPLQREGRPQERRFARGILIHRLLQHLPDMPPPQRRAAARDWLMRPPHALPEDEAQALTDEVLAIMEDPRFAALFGPDSRAEAPFAARISTDDGREILVSGQIDRLVVTDREVIVADYKTARPAPERLEDVPAEYVGQLAVYARAMESLWPGRPVRAVLVWTATPSLMEVPQEMLRVAAEPPRP